MKYLLIIIIALGALVSEPAFAQQGAIASVYGEALSQQSAQVSGGLVTCQGTNCDFCDLAAMINGVINWLFGFLTIVAVIIFAVAGFRLVTSAGNTEAATWAKQRFAYVFIGLLIMLASWLIIDTVLRGLTGQGMNVWGTFDVTNCGSMASTQSQVYDEFSPDYRETPDEAGFADGQTNPAALTPTDLVSYGGKQFNRGVVARVQNLAETYNLRVTSGYRSPEHNARVRGAANSWHLTGRAADFVGSESDMQAAAEAARNSGAIEVLIHNVGSGRHLHVVW